MASLSSKGEKGGTALAQLILTSTHNTERKGNLYLKYINKFPLQK